MIGLMNHTSLAETEGMLFVFEENDIHNFWMKNMKFGIDIIWMNDGFDVIHIEENVPTCLNNPCETYGPSTHSKYVLEVQEGFVEKHNIKLNDKLIINGLI